VVNHNKQDNDNKNELRKLWKHRHEKSNRI
jgi:hypothetical protein